MWIKEKSCLRAGISAFPCLWTWILTLPGVGLSLELQFWLSWISGFLTHLLVLGLASLHKDQIQCHSLCIGSTDSAFQEKFFSFCTYFRHFKSTWLIVSGCCVYSSLANDKSFRLDRVACWLGSSSFCYGCCVFSDISSYIPDSCFQTFWRCLDSLKEQMIFRETVWTQQMIIHSLIFLLLVLDISVSPVSKHIVSKHISWCNIDSCSITLENIVYEGLYFFHFVFVSVYSYITNILN